MCDCDNGPGYCRENIQVLTNTDNVLKELAKRRISRQYDYLSKQAWWHRAGWPQVAALQAEKPPPF